ncbi:MAG: flagellar hook basal-body protein [Deltaproteobacteria bacterium]|nr:MAG: flagellar hook basal-body protein [Deltaproteobacteria bacterium]
MSDGIYVALSGAIARTRQLETVANNLANVDSTAYRPQRVTFRSVLATATPPPPVEVEGRSVEVPVDRFHAVASVEEPAFSQGVLKQTGRSLDLALEGDGWFVVRTPNGPRYTRDGHFTRSASGFLVAQDGAKVMGKKGPVRLPPGMVEIDARGNVFVSGRAVDRLRIVAFARGDGLRREGANRYAANGQGRPSAARVHQGALEQSSVSAIGELIALVDIQRSFDALQEAIRAYREMDTQAVGTARSG